MSNALNEQISQRVRSLLVAALSEKSAARAVPPILPAGVLTEADVNDWVRAGASPALLLDSRLTALARETVERLMKSNPAQAPSTGSTAPQTTADGPRESTSRAPADSNGAAVHVAPQTPSASTPTAMERIAIGADHGGFELKEQLRAHLEQRGFGVLDCGTFSAESCDYPRFAHKVAEHVKCGDAIAGIVVDGAGIGSAIAANKVAGIRAASCTSIAQARNAREHNHAQVLTLGSRFLNATEAAAIVDSFLATPFGDGRHARRVAMIETPPTSSTAPGAPLPDHVASRTGGA
ncbi:MAG: ribose 5-phosphate isomerase B [Planctomycetota bacterium]